MLEIKGKYTYLYINKGRRGHVTDHTHLELLTDIGDVSIVVHHLNEGKAVSLPALVVVVVVGGGDLDGSRTKRHVHHLVGNYGELTVTEWVQTILPNQVLQEGEGGGRERESESENRRTQRENSKGEREKIISHYFVLFSHLVSLIVGVHGNSRISEHCLDTCCGHDQLFLRSLHGVGKGDEDTKLYLLVVAWHIEKRTTRQLNLVHLQKEQESEDIYI